jgi:adenosine deaminase
LNADRIGHGVRVVEDANVVALARERGTFFEVCITSNYQSGVISNGSPHPIKTMIANGLRTTINTDDPGISRITLNDEYKVALEDLGIPSGQLTTCVMNAIAGSFQPENERRELAARIEPVLQDLFKS